MRKDVCIRVDFFEVVISRNEKKHTIMDDKDIIMSIKLGFKNQSQALGYIYDKAEPLVASMVVKYSNLLNGGMKEIIEDIINDTMEVFYKNIVSGNFALTNTKLTTYFCSIAKNKLTDLVRKKIREKRNLEKIPQALEYYVDEFPEIDFVSHERSIIDAMETQLDSNCFNLIKDFYGNGNLSYNDLAKKYGYNSAQVVGTTMLRCRKKIASVILNNPNLLGKAADIFDAPDSITYALDKHYSKFQIIVMYCKDVAHKSQNQSLEDKRFIEEHVNEDEDLKQLISFIVRILTLHNI